MDIQKIYQIRIRS